MNDSLSTVLALYEIELLSSTEVIDWVDREILNGNEPFESLLEISLNGPDHYFKNNSYNHRSFEPFTYFEVFALKSSKLDIDSESEKEKL